MLRGRRRARGESGGARGMVETLSGRSGWWRRAGVGARTVPGGADSRGDGDGDDGPSTSRRRVDGRVMHGAGDSVRGGYLVGVDGVVFKLSGVTPSGRARGQAARGEPLALSSSFALPRALSFHPPRRRPGGGVGSGVPSVPETAPGHGESSRKRLSVQLLSTRALGRRAMRGDVRSRHQMDDRRAAMKIGRRGRLVPVSSWTNEAIPRRAGRDDGAGRRSRRRWSVDSGERNAREGGDVGVALEGVCSRRASRASRRASSKRRRRRSTSGGWRTSRETAEGPRWRVDARKGGARFAPR